jgi:tRNA (adenine22-N1)-methyltransferase
MKKLNARLSAIAVHIDAGAAVADIGSDHGYLPIYLLERDLSPKIVVTDIAEGPLARARENIERYLGCVPGSVSLRLGDGLEPVAPGEVDTVIIAGVGGETIIEIMGANPEKAAGFAKYILQPRTKVDKLRDWLPGADYAITGTDTVQERGRSCEIIVAAPRNR